MPHQNAPSRPLPRQTLADAAYSGSRHNARADHMAEQRVGRLQNPPDTGFLMQMQLNVRAGAGQRQVVPVERPNTGVIECIIVKSAKPFAA